MPVLVAALLEKTAEHSGLRDRARDRAIGGDYFFGLRRHLNPPSRGASPSRTWSDGASHRVEPGSAIGMRRRRRASLQLAPHLFKRPEALGDDIVLVDRL